jgi:hypothetical protein
MFGIPGTDILAGVRQYVYNGAFVEFLFLFYMCQ